MRYAVDRGLEIEELTFNRNKFVDGYGITHPRSYLEKWDEAYLNSRKIYMVTDGSFDQFEFTRIGNEFNIVDNKAVETILTNPISLEDIKTREKSNVSSEYAQILAGRPRVDSGLGFFVDGSRLDLGNFTEKEKRMVDGETTTVKDADNQIHAGITKAQMKQIADAIFANGEMLLMEKWTKQAAIDAAVTVQGIKDVL